MYLVKSLSRDKGSGRYTLCISPFPFIPYQIHGQSLNTHRGKHKSGGAQNNYRNVKFPLVRDKFSLHLEPFAVGPVQSRSPRGVAGYWFTKPVFFKRRPLQKSDGNFSEQIPR